MYQMFLYRICDALIQLNEQCHERDVSRTEICHATPRSHVPCHPHGQVSWAMYQMFLYRIFDVLIKFAYQKSLQIYLYVLISASSPSPGAWNLMGLQPPKDFRNSEFGIRNSEFGIRNSEFRIRNSEFRIRNSEFGIRNSEFGIRNSEFGIRNSEFGIRNCEFERK